MSLLLCCRCFFVSSLNIKLEMGNLLYEYKNIIRVRRINKNERNIVLI